MNDKQQTLLPTLSLFTSMGTLICCALPALLVSLGAGAALAGLVANAPWLIAFSQYKALVFGGSAVLIVITGVLRWRSRFAPCPADPVKAKACMRLRQFSTWVYGISVLIWCVGFFFAFIAVHLFY